MNGDNDMLEKAFRFIVISPVRNEAKNIEYAIKSVISQTIRPLKWIIVDDGSSDTTPDIVSRYLPENEWISLLRLSDRGFYDLMGGAAIKVFYKGYETIGDLDYDYLVKLDGDISFAPDYFEQLFKEFSENSKLGIASGTCFSWNGKKFAKEPSYRLHARGAARMYRKQCWDAIGGSVPKLGWDSIDVYKARMLGWETYSFEHIPMKHHVLTWTKGGIAHGKERQGRLCYLMGMHPLFFLAKAIRMVFSKPYIIGAMILCYGFIKSYAQKEERVVDKELMTYIRKDQLGRLFKNSQDNPA
ncbi:MAG: glycosyltransferase family 2 protein [Deltaproteobacteria bacterium]|nr:glycosyltransferase family 2 protein [Deltaproteobacteria bacterium]